MAAAERGDHLERIAAALVRREVSFVVIGGWAVEAQGFALGYKTNDIDFTPDLSAENLDRLSAALYDLGAEIRSGEESLAFNHSGESLGRAEVWNPTCEDGNFDLTFSPTGLDDYQRLLASCHLILLEVDGERIQVPCADLADIWQMKKPPTGPKTATSCPC